jgi:uncharacterized ParB-like nuclease family protein
MLPEMDARIQAAAEELEQAMLTLHRDEKGVHVNTLLSTMAAMTGETILRATTREDLLYGQRGPIFSPGADDVLYRARQGCVMNYIGFTAREIGLAEMAFPNIVDLLKKASDAAGKRPLPVLTIPTSDLPHFWAFGGAATARGEMLTIYARHELGPLDAVLAATLLLCRFLHATHKVLAPEIAFRLMMETLVAAIRWHPVSLGELQELERQWQQQNQPMPPARPPEKTPPA